MKTLGIVATLLMGNAYIPVEGFEKVSALSLLGVFMWFTLVRIERVLKDNTAAINELILFIKEKNHN